MHTFVCCNPCSTLLISAVLIIHLFDHAFNYYKLNTRDTYSLVIPLRLSHLTYISIKKFTMHSFLARQITAILFLNKPINLLVMLLRFPKITCVNLFRMSDIRKKEVRVKFSLWHPILLNLPARFSLLFNFKSPATTLHLAIRCQNHHPGRTTSTQQGQQIGAKYSVYFILFLPANFSISSSSHTSSGGFCSLFYPVSSAILTMKKSKNKCNELDQLGLIEDHS